MGIKEISGDADLNQPDDQGMTPLQYALAQKGAGRDKAIERLLRAAARFGTEEIVKGLIEAGAKEDRTEEPPVQKDKVNDLFAEILDKVLVQPKNKGKSPTL